MSINLLAKALGRGVEVAALVPYIEWKRRLESLDSISEVVREAGSDKFATFDLMPIQELSSEDGGEIEVRVLASDGVSQLTAYFYAQVSPEAAV